MFERALTKKQLEALRALHYGEVICSVIFARGMEHKTYRLRNVDGSTTAITGRVMALRKKRMCRYMNVYGTWVESLPLVLTPRGEEELAKFPEEV